MHTSVVFVAVVLIVCPLVAGWGAIGHAAIANTAWELLGSATQGKVNKYLPDGATMESIASLADYYAETPQGNWSEHLHFVNMNKGQTQFDMTIDCSNGCVVSAIINDTKLLTSKEIFDAVVTEPNPLEFLVHFVGDVHQPLHVGWGYDRGGNLVNVTFYDKATELHAVWDTDIIEKYNDSWSTWSSELLSAIKSNASLIPAYTKTMDPSDWATESFSYVRTDVYNFDPTPKADATPYLGDHYYDHNLPIIRERLIAASIRLATLLNTIFA